MSFTTSVIATGVMGDQHYVDVDIDLSNGLSNDGFESFHPSTIGINSPVGMTVLGKENAGYVFNWDHVNEDRLEVHYGNYDQGADSVLAPVPSGTDVSEVRVRFEGER